jgi:hypothetical protein
MALLSLEVLFTHESSCKGQTMVVPLPFLHLLAKYLFILQNGKATHDPLHNEWPF